MNTTIFTLPNIITLCRLVAIPLVWVWAFQDKPTWVGIATFTLLLTDILDGWLARRLNSVTEFGGKLDSLADNLLLPSGLIWLFMLRPELLRGHYAVISAIAVCSYVAAVGIIYVRFQRFPPNLHLYSAKASGVFAAIFACVALTFGVYPPMLYLAGGLFLLSNLEEIAVASTRSELHDHIGSIFRKSSD